MTTDAAQHLFIIHEKPLSVTDLQQGQLLCQCFTPWALPAVVNNIQSHVNELD